MSRRIFKDPVPLSGRIEREYKKQIKKTGQDLNGFINAAIKNELKRRSLPTFLEYVEQQRKEGKMSNIIINGWLKINEEV